MKRTIAEGNTAQQLLKALNSDPCCPSIQRLGIHRDPDKAASVVTITYDNGYGQRLEFDDEMLRDAYVPLALVVERIKSDWSSMPAPYQFNPNLQELRFEYDGKAERVAIRPPDITFQNTVIMHPTPAYPRVGGLDRLAEEQARW